MYCIFISPILPQTLSSCSVLQERRTDKISVLHHVSCKERVRRQVVCASNNSDTSRREVLRLIRNIVLGGTAMSSMGVPTLRAQAFTRGLEKGVAESVLDNVSWPPEWPYSSTDFVRFDSRPDNEFYSYPRLVRHIDDGAVAALKQYYKELVPGLHDVLDICSSLESYLPTFWKGRDTVSGLGMNDIEMEKNPALTEYVVADLNIDATLPYKDDSFDLAMCNVSIDYLVNPRKVMSELVRVLRKGGRVVFSFSNRVFATKAVAIWMGGGDEDHIYTVASYVHYAGAFSEPQVIDLSPRKKGVCTGDPLYIVTAIRKS